MKLCIVCLLIAFACVMAAPIPDSKEESKVESKGLFESKGLLERLVAGPANFMKNVITMGENMISPFTGGNPFIKMMSGSMKGMIDMGENMAKIMDMGK